MLSFDADDEGVCKPASCKFLVTSSRVVLFLVILTGSIMSFFAFPPISSHIRSFFSGVNTPSFPPHLATTQDQRSASRWRSITKCVDAKMVFLSKID